MADLRLAPGNTRVSSAKTLPEIRNWVWPFERGQCPHENPLHQLRKLEAEV